MSNPLCAVSIIITKTPANTINAKNCIKFYIFIICQIKNLKYANFLRNLMLFISLIYGRSTCTRSF